MAYYCVTILIMLIIYKIEITFSLIWLLEKLFLMEKLFLFLEEIKLQAIAKFGILLEGSLTFSKPNNMISYAFVLSMKRKLILIEAKRIFVH